MSSTIVAHRIIRDGAIHNDNFRRMISIVSIVPTGRDFASTSSGDKNVLLFTINGTFVDNLVIFADSNFKRIA